jgi:hypothetical protein
METTLTTFEIPVHDFRAFEAEFAKLAKKAAKLGVVAPTFEVIEEKTVKAVINECGEVSKPARRLKVIKVTGQAPKLNGWNFVAVLQHEETGNIVRIVPGAEAFKVERDMRTAKPTCEHCRYDRRRNDTYVVAHDDGRQLQVGRNCLRDFTGHDSPEAIARWAELLSAFVERTRGDGDGEGFGGGEDHGSLERFLAYVVACIGIHGWMSRSKARDSYVAVEATADTAWANMFPSKELMNSPKRIRPTEADEARAQSCLNTVVTTLEAKSETPEGLDDFEHNVRIVTDGGSVNFRSAGIAAAIINMADRIVGREIERKRALASTHQGTVGKREVFTLTVTRVIDIESIYGVSKLHILSDAQGNVFKWKASNERLDVGGTYSVKGTVKAHEDYKGVKQTTLSRCAATKV